MAGRVKYIVTAYHEAAHALMALYYGRNVQYILVSPRAPGNGMTVLDPSTRNYEIGRITDGNIRRAWDQSLERYTNDIQIYLAGPLAEAKALNSPMRLIGGKADFLSAKQITLRLEDIHAELSRYTTISWPDRENYLNQLRKRTRRQISLPRMWNSIQAVAEELAHRHLLTGADVAAIIQNYHANHGQFGLTPMFSTVNNAITPLNPPRHTAALA